jgi:hypothetical protein
MEVSGHIHARIAFLSGRESIISIGLEDGWTQSLSGPFKQYLLSLAGIESRFFGRPSRLT